MERVVGLLISGFAVRIYGAATAIYVGMQAVHYIRDTLGAVSAAFPG